MQVDFYHLTATPVERALPRIAERVLESGGRLLIVSAREAQRTALDRALWDYAPESFLPHALAGGEHDASQPILLAAGCPAGPSANAASHVALIDGVWHDEALRFERAFHFFDDETVSQARTAWKGLAGRDDVERRYWKQDVRGRWSQAA